MKRKRNMLARLAGIPLTMALLMGLLAGSVALQAVPAQAATPQEIEDSILAGLAWLAGQQYASGSWPGSYPTAKTCLALVKLQERAYELGYPSPFDPAYEYSDEVALGWDFVFTRIAQQWPLPVQNHMSGATGTMDNPDTNANLYGLYFPGEGRSNYSTGICLMALAASGTPGRPNDRGRDYNHDLTPDTFGEIAQEVVDWLAFSQTDGLPGEGGWDYDAHNNAAGRADNSISGYAVLGLAYGESFGCSVPGWVKTELDRWINYIQCSDGGSGYDSTCSWVNQLKTGNLIFQMTFVGDDSSTPRFQAALAYIEQYWRHSTIDPGWGYNQYPAEYQAMYCLMKGLDYSGVDLLDTDGGMARDDDWFNQEPPASPAQDFASVLVAQQQPSGFWFPSTWGDHYFYTIWALLTLEKVAPTYNPLNLSKDDGLAEDECVDPGENITYDLCYDSLGNDYEVHGVTLVDELPDEVNFVSATGGGSYSTGPHEVTWNIGTLPAGAAQQCVQLVAQVDPSTPLGATLVNVATIDSDETGPAEAEEETDICEEPTAIELLSLAAEAGPGGVILAWETGTEVDNAGFNLYRATAEAGPYAKINGALISAQGDPASGASYSFADTPGHGTFYYKLEDLDLYGVSTLHGPVSVQIERKLLELRLEPRPEPLRR